MKRIVEIFKCNTNKKKISLTLVSEGALYIKIDPSAFNRIMNNIMDNAVKYTKEETGEINVLLKSGSSFIYLEIKDNGKGISKNELKRIFKPYYRTKRKTNEDGLGIGLFLVKSIIDSCNAGIEVQSELDKGTCFTITFPRHLLSKNDKVTDFVPRGITKRKTVVFSKETYEINKPTLLIVDDNINFLSYLQQILLQHYNVYYAINGGQAFEKIISIPKPDIIISDIIMEQMNGHEFYDKILHDSRYNDIPFIFITSGTGMEEKIQSLKKGVIDYITKPFSIELLEARIEAILKNRRLTKETEMKRIEDQVSKVIRKKGDDKFLSFEKKCNKYEISPREKEVLRLLLEGFIDKEIAGKLSVSVHTTKNHTRHIYKKCNIQNRVELLNLFKE